MKNGRKKGTKKTGGRIKGTLNKTSSTLKEMILQALDESGGVNYLKTQAKLNPGPFMSLVGKVLPMTIAGDPANPLSHNVSITITPVKATILKPDK